MPQLADFDGDGLVDLISGSNCCEPCRLLVWPGSADGSFGERRAVWLNQEFSGRKAAFPMFTDWDRNGKQDLIVGLWRFELHANVNRFNFEQGSAAPINGQPLRPKSEADKLSFRDVTPKELLTEGSQFKTTRFRFARFGDWDGDTNTDLLALHRGGSLVWYRNRNPREGPRFDTPRLLFKPSDDVYVHSFATVDWNNDGKLEVVVSVSREDSAKETGRSVRLELLGPAL